VVQALLGPRKLACDEGRAALQQRGADEVSLDPVDRRQSPRAFGPKAGFDGIASPQRKLAEIGADHAVSLAMTLQEPIMPAPAERNAAERLSAGDVEQSAEVLETAGHPRKLARNVRMARGCPRTKSVG
jgi:hypothetical protein